jgi:hypothetical protein
VQYHPSKRSSSPVLLPTVQIPLYTQSTMCLGTTVACRSCQREAILFYPGGRCGEVEPFPSWHRIRGHFRRIRRCHDCIQSHQGALRRERENFIRDSRRAKSLRQYFRGERAHPLPDEEYHLRSQGRYRLERFDLVFDVHSQPPASVSND